MTTHGGVLGGAVAVIAGATGRDPAEARDAAIGAFRGLSSRPTVLAEGALTLAFTESSECCFHQSHRTICLIEGVLYELDGIGEESCSGGNSARRMAAAYERLGMGCLDQARGEFWGLIWDRTRAEGIVMTDQMGGRTPYWTRDGGDVVLASEIPDLLAVLRRSPDADPLAVAHWIALTAPPPGRTLFAGVRRLPAGHALALDRRSRDPVRYWSPRYREPFEVPRDELVGRLRDSLKRAVTRRVSDAQTTGILLSGGLDSSVVAALATDSDLRPHLYSAVFPGRPTVDESELIELTAQRLALPSTRLAVRGGSVIGGALSYLSAWQQPPTSPNLFFWGVLLSRAAEDGMRVMLDGEGGDELFGFSPYLLADRLRQGRLLASCGLLRHWPSQAPRATARRQWFRLSRFGLKGALPWWAHTTTRKLRGLDAYAPAGMRPGVARAWLESEESAFAWKRLPGPRWWAWLVESVTRGIGPALVYEQSRRRAGLSGLVALHPLVDVDVIELMLRIPPELAFDVRHSRPLLREAVSGLLPDAVRLRGAKSNFDAVFHDALAGPDFPVAHRLLAARDAEVRAYLDLDVIQGSVPGLEPPPPGFWRQTWAIRLWRLVTLECWLRSRSDPSFVARLAERENLVPTDCQFLGVG